MTEPNRYDNLSASQIADEYGRINAIKKAAEAELEALKGEIVSRKLDDASGDSWAITVAYDQIAWRLDGEAVKAFLGPAHTKFLKMGTSNTVRVKPNARRLPVAA